MNRLAEDVFQIPLMPRNGVNAYLLGDVLVDAGMKGSAKKILAAVGGHAVGAHALTHAHVDHAGGSKRVMDALDIPMWAPAGDADDVESGVATPADNPFKPVARRVGGFDGVPVTRRLREGDEVGPGFTVLDVPGHSPGHIAFWRESDRTLVAGDVFFNMNVFTGRYGLRQPLRLPTVDPARNRASERRLAALEPALVLFGHGPPLRDPAKLRAFAAALPQD